MNRFIVIILAVILMALPVMAAEKKKEATRVEADRMEYTSDKKESIFYGNVVADTNGLKINAEKMKVIFGEGKKVKEIFAYTNVKIEQEGSVALCKEAHMVVATNEVTLTGDVKVWRGKNYFEGEKAVMNSETGKLAVDGDEQKRVKIIFTPEDE